MLKHAESRYAAGRIKPADGRGWWKWKVDPYTVDAAYAIATATPITFALLACLIEMPRTSVTR